MYVNPKTFNHIKRQLKIAKRHGMNPNPGKLKKQHAMDCGNTRCGLCSNARRLRGTKTVNEYRAHEAYTYSVKMGELYNEARNEPEFVCMEDWLC